MYGFLLMALPSSNTGKTKIWRLSGSSVKRTWDSITTGITGRVMVGADSSF
ncbi:hypothetical protein [Sphingobacterium phlebotomi]|uniref:hypothetical protein n=1 Tax=Sphingobacterium phlebotomi TaxID=2605433 RepID=UPI001653AEEA|nr:hypothetical protein [Sphingobacterium phlebotomi]